MDKKFLDKVVGQLVYETIMDYEKGEIQFPFTVHPLSRRTVISFSSPFLPHFLFSPSLSLPFPFIPFHFPSLSLSISSLALSFHFPSLIFTPHIQFLFPFTPLFFHSSSLKIPFTLIFSSSLVDSYSK